MGNGLARHLKRGAKRKDMLLAASCKLLFKFKFKPKLQLDTIRAAAGIPPGLALDAESPI
jgi:hypothetical protein